ncbi:polysaccharide deacetylase family protein [Halolamina litorea]|uniref:Polysaccharide deacetylase family protein n=1 Tax=Halolamina litorea TaxID=1515593 RepID=A0ABD6BU08_9EURY|nr:polysaccharide deacetylase family protein [Halolamina litorea]
MSGNPPDAADFPGLEGEERPIPDGHEFVLLLTHDVDRPYKTFQAPYYALRGQGNRLKHLASLLPGREPYWQFETVMALERSLGVRSAFYFLSEQRVWERPPREWLSPRTWQLFAGRYSLSDPAIQHVVETLDDGGWEVGLHGSYDSPDDRGRLRDELAAIEDVLGDDVTGGRQHYLNLEVPETWRHYRDLGLRYDTSLGSSEETGFDHGYGLKRPFDDEFVVFPLTIMENALPDPSERFDDAWGICADLLHEAAENDAVMTVLWHPRTFSATDFPGYGQLYRRLVQTALDLGAWVGSPAEFYEVAALDRPQAQTH